MTHYSLEWATTIYERFTGHYARATKLLLRFCGKTDDLLIECLRFHQTAWELLKIIIKTIDRELSFAPYEILCSDAEQLVEKCILDHKDRALTILEKTHGNEKLLLTEVLGSIMLSLDGFQGCEPQAELW